MRLQIAVKKVDAEPVRRRDGFATVSATAPRHCSATAAALSAAAICRDRARFFAHRHHECQR
mgnify:CR=1 FL=1